MDFSQQKAFPIQYKQSNYELVSSAKNWAVLQEKSLL